MIKPLKSRNKNQKKPSAQSVKIEKIIKIIDKHTGWMVGWWTDDKNKEKHQKIAAKKILKYLSK